MALPTVLGPVNEKTTPVYTGVLKDTGSNDLYLSALAALTLTYYHREGGRIINNRDEQNVLNANNVVVTDVSASPATVSVAWTLQVADTTIRNDAMDIERRRAIFAWQATNGQFGKHRVDIDVRNLAKIA